MLTRTLAATVARRVEYELTDLGHQLFVPVLALSEWTKQNTPQILAARAVFDALATGT